MVEENIGNYISTLSDLLALVDANSIGYIDTLQDEQYPKVTYKVMTDPPYDQDQFIINDRWERWRFFIHSKDKWECKEIADVLTDNLNGLFGDVDGRYIDLIKRLGGTDPEKLDNDTYEQTLDFRIIYH